MASVSAGRAPRLEVADAHQRGDDACDSYAYQHGLRGGSRLLGLICGNRCGLFDLLDKTIDGFGEVFRTISFGEIRTSTIQSRALAGVANATYVFCLPGSSGACRTAWDRVVADQLDYRTRPCNLVELMPPLLET